MGFTIEMIRQIRKERDRHLEAAREHSQLAEAAAQMLRSAKKLTPQVFEDESEASLEAIEEIVVEQLDDDAPIESLKVPDAIRRVLRNADRSMTKLGIRQRLVESGFPEERLGTNAAYFYTAMRRLEKGHELRRRGKLYRLYG